MESIENLNGLHDLCRQVIHQLNYFYARFTPNDE